MGREIRRVPVGWKHPRNERGNYEALFDRTWEEALADWQEAKDDWDNDGAERARVEAEYGITDFAEWHGEAPTPDGYRKAFDSEPTHYQIYETVTEGTPTSPVFADLDEMEAWLLDEGYSETAASRFVEGGWAPSFVMSATKDGARMSGIGIHSLDLSFDAQP